MQDMSKDGLILAFDMDTEKCKICMLTKITKKPFQNVKRETKVLELIHYDLCDLHATLSLGNKKYFVTFIVDASRFYVIERNDSIEINSIIKSMDAIFNENRFSSVPKLSLRILNGTEDDGGSVVPEKVIEQGFRQKSGIDNFDTYAPVACISTLRRLIAMASIHNLIIHQIDVKIAFLNGELENEIYMNQPHGFIMPGNKNKVDLTKEFLSSRFFLKDMEEADVILVGKLSRYNSNPGKRTKSDVKVALTPA
nr:zinc finger, CCHC-type [Tanacetum cinerariifolium]